MYTERVLRTLPRLEGMTRTRTVILSSVLLSRASPLQRVLEVMGVVLILDTIKVKLVAPGRGDRWCTVPPIVLLKEE